MIYLLKQEIYKNYHKKSIYINILIQLFIMISMAILSLNYSGELLNGKSLILDNFNSTIWIQFSLMFFSSNILLNEYKYGTIKLILSKEFSRTKIYISKVSFIFIHSLLLYGISFITTLILKLFFTNISISIIFSRAFMFNFFGQFLITWLILSIVFLLSNIFVSSGLSITISIVYYFVSIIASNLLFGIISKHTFLRFNPINMMNFVTQISNKGLQNLTLLNIQDYIIMIPIYIIIFIYIGNLLFIIRNK